MLGIMLDEKIWKKGLNIPNCFTCFIGIFPLNQLLPFTHIGEKTPGNRLLNLFLVHVFSSRKTPQTLTKAQIDSIYLEILLPHWKYQIPGSFVDHAQ